MADRTRPIVRLEVMNRMVTEGYQKGVYRRVTKGIRIGEVQVAASECIVQVSNGHLCPNTLTCAKEYNQFQFGVSNIKHTHRVASSDGRLPHLPRSSTRVG